MNGEALDEQQQAALGAAEDPPHAKPGPGRVVPAVLSIVSGLLLGIVLGSVAVVGVAGPEVFGDRPGGTLRVEVWTMCGSIFGDMAFRMGEECFNDASATVHYSLHRSQEVDFETRGSFGIADANIELAQARARLIVDTDRGTWTREMWVPEETHSEVQIDSESPRTESSVMGRHAGMGLLAGVGAILGFALTVGALFWLVKGWLGAAEATRGLLIVWAAGNVIWFLVWLAQGRAGIGMLLGPAWFLLLQRAVGRWIAARSALPSPPPGTSPS